MRTHSHNGLRWRLIKSTDLKGLPVNGFPVVAGRVFPASTCSLFELKSFRANGYYGLVLLRNATEMFVT